MFKKKRSPSIDAENPDVGYIYAVSTGKYLGEFFVFIKKAEKDCLGFLSLPKMIVRNIPKDKFMLGLTNKVLEFQEILPADVRDVCIEQYNKTNNE